LRKSFMAAGAAALAIGAAGVAYAQNPAPAPTATGSISPSKAGTKAKPKAVKVTLSVKNNVESKTTAAQIQITFPSTLKLSTKGLKACTASDDAIIAAPTTACKGSVAGKGTSNAIINPYAATPFPIHFNVTPIVGKNQLIFYLHATNFSTDAVLHGKIVGRKLTIAINPELQQPTPGVYSALNDLSTTLKLTKGTASLFSTTGCTGGKQKVGVKISYVPNPTPPAASSASTTANAKCSK
jgi:hypothetical protein